MQTDEVREAVEYKFQIISGDTIPSTGLQRFYKRNGYKGKIQPNDICAWLSKSDVIVAAVRLTPSPQADDEYIQLKGLWLAKDLRGKGIGGQFLNRLGTYLLQTNVPCYCLAFSHLEKFYITHQFKSLPEEDAPSLLRQQLQRYRNRGNQLRLMQFQPEQKKIRSNA